jgi:hypothetical protein
MYKHIDCTPSLENSGFLAVFPRATGLAYLRLPYISPPILASRPLALIMQQQSQEENLANQIRSIPASDVSSDPNWGFGGAKAE